MLTSTNNKKNNNKSKTSISSSLLPEDYSKMNDGYAKFNALIMHVKKIRHFIYEAKGAVPKGDHEITGNRIIGRRQHERNFSMRETYQEMIHLLDKFESTLNSEKKQYFEKHTYMENILKFDLESYKKIDENFFEEMHLFMLNYNKYKNDKKRERLNSIQNNLKKMLKPIENIKKEALAAAAVILNPASAGSAMSTMEKVSTMEDNVDAALAPFQLANELNSAKNKFDISLTGLIKDAIGLQQKRIDVVKNMVIELYGHKIWLTSTIQTIEEIELILERAQEQLGFDIEKLEELDHKDKLVYPQLPANDDDPWQVLKNLRNKMNELLDLYRKNKPVVKEKLQNIAKIHNNFIADIKNTSFDFRGKIDRVLDGFETFARNKRGKKHKTGYFVAYEHSQKWGYDKKKVDVALMQVDAVDKLYADSNYRNFNWNVLRIKVRRKRNLNTAMRKYLQIEDMVQENIRKFKNTGQNTLTASRCIATVLNAVLNKMKQSGLDINKLDENVYAKNYLQDWIDYAYFAYTFDMQDGYSQKDYYEILDKLRNRETKSFWSLLIKGKNIMTINNITNELEKFSSLENSDNIKLDNSTQSPIECKSAMFTNRRDVVQEIRTVPENLRHRALQCSSS